MRILSDKYYIWISIWKSIFYYKWIFIKAGVVGNDDFDKVYFVFLFFFIMKFVNFLDLRFVKEYERKFWFEGISKIRM